LVQRLEAGPANLRLSSDAMLVAHFRSLQRQFPRPAAIGIGIAGAREPTDRRRVAQMIGRVWPGVPARIEHDLETALAAAPAGSKSSARVVILSGTGSCCYGRNARGVTAKVGGWGHQLGDRGSGYDIALTALRSLIRELDHSGRWGPLGRSILRVLQLNEPDELIAWLQSAPKDSVAALSPEIFRAASRGDEVARRTLEETAAKLADDAEACALRLARRGEPVEFVLAGGVLLRQRGFSRQLARRLKKRWPRARITPLPRESAWGAVVLSGEALRGTKPRPGGQRDRRPAKAESFARIPDSPKQSPTEERNPRSRHLDQLPLEQAISLMIDEDGAIPKALRDQRVPLAKLIRAVVRSFRCGGRLFYVGAGTSGRLGVLDASECPPTFGTPPHLVQGIIAGGTKALVAAVEGAEDDVDAGARAIRFRGVQRRDVVIGIAASGRTPFVWGALHEARRRGAITALVCCNPHLHLGRPRLPDIMVALDTGPEVLTGSTRLKAGTATKLVLNMITTLSMVKLGKVASNLMVDLNPSNTKLRARAVRIVGELAKVNDPDAKEALASSKWVVRSALRRLRKRRG
jgi:N-acetylmuramic acid 6-phosphate etherase